MIKKTFLNGLLILILAQPMLGQENITKDVNQLPATAREFVQTHFPKNEISYIIIDKEFLSKDYEVKLKGGEEIKFSKDGEWIEMEAKKKSSLPVSVLPDVVATYLNNSFPNVGVEKIEKEFWGYDIELINGLDIKLDKKGRYLEVDD
ncbi:MAG: PepSY-like domain-containing protein [Bacteroidales bacterium]|jgi:hypothetical protein|nr:PepSY-like domain-containing protein [Bacteroidales bacterium]